LASFGWRVCGATDYFKGAGIPQRVEDLDAHRLIVWGDHRPPIDEVNWLADAGRRSGSPRRAAVEVNSLTGMLRAVQSGLGLAALPDYMGPDLDGLLQVLPELKAPKLDAYFVYPEEMRHSKRVAVFRDFLVAELAAH
jgi:DNA-binding transcriptional LysR family regulator